MKIRCIHPPNSSNVMIKIAIYGIIFLLRRPYAFPLKGLAIAGTVLHCAWTALLTLSIIINIMSAN